MLESLGTRRSAHFHADRTASLRAANMNELSALNGSSMKSESSLDTIAAVAEPVSVPLKEESDMKEDGEQPSKSLAQFSSSLSASSSLSGSLPHHGASPPLSSARFKHFIYPSVAQVPHAFELCQRYIEEKNVEGLARIARNRGLPPELRQYAWPLLLQSHPFVTTPSIVAEYQPSKKRRDKVPFKKIKTDLDRIKRKRHLGSYNNSNATSRGISRGDTHDHTPGTASPSTPSPQSEEHNNGQDLNVSENVGDAISAYFNRAIQDQRYERIESALASFLEKWGHLIPYESGLAWTACDLAHWVDPMFEMKLAMRGSQSNTPDLTPLMLWEESVKQVAPFDQVLEQFLLFMFHSPPPNADGPYGPCDSQFTDRISTFLAIMEQLVPTLSKHFAEEDVFSVFDGDDSLVWWIKWLGVRVWEHDDGARFWDMYLGWRPEKLELGNASEEEALGVDTHPFWDALNTDSKVIEDLNIQHMFICVAMLKAKMNTLLELDQSELRQCLMNFKGTPDRERVVLEAAELWREWNFSEQKYDDDE